MKKLLSIILSLALSTTLFVGCTSQSDSQDQNENDNSSETTVQDAIDVNVLALKGPTAMGMVKFMDEADNENVKDNNYNFSITASVDEVAPKLLQGDADIAAIPANLSSVLFNNTQGDIQVIAINTLGVLYIVENSDTINSVEDLKGKTIYASGKGATPEYALNYVLSKNGIDPVNDVNIEWKSEHTECLTALTSNENAIAMLPQPFVTSAQTKVDNIRIALDLSKEWEDLQADEENPSALITGVAVARTEFINENPAVISNFMEHYKDSVDYVNSNVKDGAKLVGKYDIVPATIAEKAIPECNITFINGEDMKEKLSGYLQVLHEQNPKSVGGTLPSEEFYYTK